ncbi:RpiB/LacA/LacB family sugar-phosphate isomerase [Actinomyces sp. HMT897]|jgi:sugar-phosphate isomerase, RpiB/LacA/LacB family|uniref:RpiB/LacA/LacB family sugar-phosphate isomerase n=1 Tax=Actinomyces sp. HMT897 TaxID=2789424 RepID=UPI00190B435D|nr:RpiB/LacA/LacB family sugar-phosphate isomerase [Actinomyces sp. HMT897]QQO77680.1 RpiB/LacA/LacB family sugar-phosphate isomerase [Actinomyces sp. HMT897]
MRIALASDHAGFPLKREIAAWLESQGHTTEDFGTPDTRPADLSDHVYPAALAVARGQADRGVFVDGVGYGSALIANRVRGLTAVVCQDPFCARLAREHTDSNVLCLGGKIIGSAIALEIVRVWMTTGFLDQPKYRRRVDKVEQISNRHLVALEDLDL